MTGMKPSLADRVRRQLAGPDAPPGTRGIRCRASDMCWVDFTSRIGDAIVVSDGRSSSQSTAK